MGKTQNGCLLAKSVYVSPFLEGKTMASKSSTWFCGYSIQVRYYYNFNNRRNSNEDLINRE